MKKESKMGWTIYGLIVFLISITSLQCVKAQSTATITGIVPKSTDGDTIELTLWKHYMLGRIAFGDSAYERYISPLVFRKVVKNGKVSFALPLAKEIQYFSLESNAFNRKLIASSFEEKRKDPRLNKHRKENNYLHFYAMQLIQPGDQIRVTVSDGTFQFVGRGSDKLGCLYAIREGLRSDPDAPELHRTSYSGVSEAYVKNFLKFHQNRMDYGLAMLKRYRKQLSPLAYQIIYTDQVSKGHYLRNYWASYYTRFKKNEEIADILELYGKEFYNTPLPPFKGIPAKVLGLSCMYSKLTWCKIKSDARYEKDTGKEKSIEANQFEYVAKNYSGLLRDKILFRLATDLVRQDGVNQDTLETSLRIAANNIRTPELQRVTAGLVETYSKGQSALDFEFRDQEGNTVRLSDFKGKMVFIDMWFTGCGACQKLADAMPEIEEAFKGRDDIVFLSISIDKDKEKWLKSIDKNAEPSKEYRFAGKHYSGEEAIYLYTAGRGSDDPFIQKYVALGYPTLMLVDRSGNIYSVNPPRPSLYGDRNQEVIQYLKKALQDNDA